MWMSLFSGVVWAMGQAPSGAAGGGGNPLAPFLPLIIIFAIFYFLLIRPQQKQAKKHREFLQNLKKGEWVMTAGGLRGRVVNVGENVVTLELPPDNVKVKITKSYIAGSLKTEGEK